MAANVCFKALQEILKELPMLEDVSRARRAERLKQQSGRRARPTKEKSSVSLMFRRDEEQDYEQQVYSSQRVGLLRAYQI